MKVLITGGFGYVGSRLAQSLVEHSDHEVILGSRKSYCLVDWLPEASVREINWSNPAGLQKVCTDIDVIIHLAAMNEIESANNQSRALEVNGVYTARLVESAIHENVSRFIYLSTAHVYCSPLEGNIDETVCPSSLHPYATSHRAAEDTVLAAHHQNNLDAVVLRLSNSFGVPAHANINRWSLLVNDLCKQAVTTRKLRLRSSGLQRRDFITLTDVCNAIEHFIGLDVKELGDGIFNVGGDWAPTIHEIAKLVAGRVESILGYKPEVITQPQKNTEDNIKLNYDIGKLLKTGFQLQESIITEIDDTIDFCKKEFDS